MHIMVTLYWGYLTVLWLFHLVCILYCGCFNWFCNVWVCVCVGFVMCGCMYVWGCFGHVCTYFKLFVPCIFSTYGMKTNWFHYFIRILLDLYMFRAHRPIFRTVRTAVHTTIGSVSVQLCSRALYVVACLGDWLFSTTREQSPWQATTYRARVQSGTDTEPMVVWTAVRTLLKMGLWVRNM